MEDDGDLGEWGLEAASFHSLAIKRGRMRSIQLLLRGQRPNALRTAPALPFHNFDAFVCASGLD